MKHEMLLKVEQKLSQELIQSLKLLQMPSLDLAQMTRQELTENLFLEEEESSEAQGEEPGVSAHEAPDRSDPKLDKIDWEDHLRDEGEFYVRPEKEQREPRLPRTPVSEKTLHEHLTDQLHLSRLGKKDVLIGEYIVGNIDENGYLVFPVEEIAKDTYTSPERISEILSVIQALDPPGVGARDSKESLLIQIMQGELPEPDRIYVALGTMGTAVGLMLGLKAAGLKSRVMPVRIVDERFADGGKLVKLFHKTNAFLHSLDPSFPVFELSVKHGGIVNGFLGRGYAHFSEEGMEAVTRMEKSEGITLDGTYTGKTFAALIHDAKKRDLRDRVILFWNTYNSRDFSDATSTVDYRSLPRCFHRYFEDEVQRLDSI